MRAIYLREINSFFSSLAGYVVIAVFLVILGLAMFVFEDTSLLDHTYATLDQLFGLAPTIFTFLIPAVTMRSFADENQSGAIELLVTRPLSDWSIVLGKFLACITLVILALAPTLLYYLTVYQLGSPKGNIDSGGVMGAYIGLILLASIFTAIGLFASSLSNNQIVAFLLAVFLCFTFYWGFDYLSRLPVFTGKYDDWIQMLGINYHYNSISRGVVDSRDVLYYLCVGFWFLWLTVFSLGRRKW